MFIIRALFLLWSFQVLAEEDWLEKAEKRIDEDTVTWMRELLKKDKSPALGYSQEALEMLSKEKCKVSSVMSDIQPHEIYVFLSFSVTDATWLSLSEEVNKANGTIVVRGLPQNSFKEFYKKVKSLDQKGFSAPLQINPKLFDDYQISHVPTFVILNGDHYDKVSGNISLYSAVELLANLGGSEKAVNLFKRFKGIK
ncbi:MAG: type-F conjugative transfer system pilin assembly protein TrbC [Parachlamydia sp.]|nr:MAG: type-F conjugative transfer system pilin assembly protein TrbC [Parachlamydia sp.]